MVFSVANFRNEETFRDLLSALPSQQFQTLGDVAMQTHGYISSDLLSDLADIRDNPEPGVNVYNTLRRRKSQFATTRRKTVRQSIFEALNSAEEQTAREEIEDSQNIIDIAVHGAAPLLQKREIVQ